MDNVRIGFVGAGFMGQVAHLRNYAAQPGCELAALAEVRPKLGQRVAARYGVATVYAHPAEMLAAEKLDGLVAILPFGLHGEVLPELLKTGLPVLTEKPAAGTSPIARELVEKAEHSSAKWLVAYHKRSDPAVLRAKETLAAWLASGEAGALRYIRVSMPPGDWCLGAQTEAEKSDEPSPPGGKPASSGLPEPWAKRHAAFVNYYIHQVNLLHHLADAPYQVVYADATLLVGRARSETSAPVTLALEMAPYQTKHGWDETILVGFEKGYLKLELPSPLAMYQPGRLQIRLNDMLTEPVLPPVHAMRQQAAHFLAAIRGASTPLCTGRQALEDLRVADEFIQYRMEHEKA